MLLELMDERKLKDADVVKATGISCSVWHGWITGITKTTMLDGNILAISRYFNVSINYLAFGVGDSNPYYKDELNKEDEK